MPRRSSISSKGRTRRKAKAKVAASLPLSQQPIVEDLVNGELPGWHTRKTSKGFMVIELDLEADPKYRSAKAIEELRRRQPNDREFRREYRRDWTVASGEGFYAEFLANGGREKYVHRCYTPLDPVRAPIFRGWDFGIRKPAVIWGQKDPDRDRVWILREFCPEGVNTYQLRDIVLCLSGQMEPQDCPETTREAVYRWLARITKDPNYPDPPWFDWSRLGSAPRFMDFAGPEAYDSRGQVEHLDKDRTHADILYSGGIQISILNQPVSARENVVRKLLMVQEDGWPGLIIDPACPVLIAGFEGGIAYAEPTLHNPLPDEPAKDGIFEHPHDALGYALINLVGMEDLPFRNRGEGKGATMRQGGNVPLPAGMGLMETRIGMEFGRPRRWRR